MSAQDVLDECKALIDERGKKYGCFDAGMRFLTQRLTDLGLNITRHTDSPRILFGLKLTRMEETQMKHRDSCMDAINYLAQYIHQMDKVEGWHNEPN